MYLGFPGALYLITLLSLLFSIKHDSIKNLITNEKLVEARAHVMLVYKHCNPKNVDQYIAFLRKSCGKKSSGYTIADALTHPNCRKCTWTNIGYIIFHELTGINVILIYSNQIFT